MKKSVVEAILIALGVFILVITMPLALNRLILKERQFDVVGEDRDWLQFWPVYLNAIGTLAMAITTFYTLKANQKQMADMIESEERSLFFTV